MGLDKDLMMKIREFQKTHSLVLENLNMQLRSGMGFVFQESQMLRL